MLIVFLFLNSWRSTIITGLTLPIALIGTFLFMYALGFTINGITMMALSLCVGLLIDDAIVVRENIVRHVRMGKSAHQAALDGTNEIGLAVLATTLSIVAVFLPIGFMGGIVGKFFHEFGLTIVAAVLISMFVSFTLDPMLSSIWNDPQSHGVHHGRPVTLYDKTVGRVTGLFDRFSEWLLLEFLLNRQAEFRELFDIRPGMKLEFFKFGEDHERFLQLCWFYRLRWFRRFGCSALGDRCSLFFGLDVLRTLRWNRASL